MFFLFISFVLSNEEISRVFSCFRYFRFNFRTDFFLLSSLLVYFCSSKREKLHLICNDWSHFPAMWVCVCVCGNKCHYPTSWNRSLVDICHSVGVHFHDWNETKRNKTKIFCLYRNLQFEKRTRKKTATMTTKKKTMTMKRKRKNEKNEHNSYSKANERTSERKWCGKKVKSFEWVHNGCWNKVNVYHVC